MARRLENLEPIVGVLKSGAITCRRSARRAQGGDLGTVFLDHAESREAAARVGTALDDTHRTPAGSLEEPEVCMLEAFRQALHQRDEKVFAGYMAGVEKSHDRMRGLERAKVAEAAAER